MRERNSRNPGDKFKFFGYLFVGLLVFLCAALTHGASLDGVQSKLEVARENLRVSMATEKRISAEMEQLKKSGKASPEILTYYETYLERVQAMVSENRKIVQEMEAVYVGTETLAAGSGPSISVRGQNILETGIPEEKIVDDLAVLDSELNQSLADFDEMLLKKLDAMAVRMDEIRSRSAEKMNGLAGEAAEAARQLRESGVDVNTSSQETGTDAREGEMESEEGVAESQEGTVDSDSTAANDRDKRTGTGSDSRASKEKQERRSSSHDDDIVARQLREAAENETDPELKEKLWKEYEDYKNSGN
jgi:hypothetical protein